MIRVMQICASQPLRVDSCARIPLEMYVLPHAQVFPVFEARSVIYLVRIGAKSS